jgi:hypothetical protein
VDSQAADGSLFCGGKSVYLRDSTVPYAYAIFTLPGAPAVL